MYLFFLAETSIDLKSCTFNELNSPLLSLCNIALFLVGKKDHFRSFVNHSDFILERIRQHVSNHFENIHIS